MKAFDLTVPPGFVRFDLPIADDSGVRRLVAAATHGAPPQSLATIAGGLHAGLVSLFAQLEQAGCFLAYSCAPHSMLGPAQPMITFRPLGVGVSEDPMAGLLALAAEDPTSELLDIEPAVCLRSTRITDLDLATELPRLRDEFDLVDPDGRAEGLSIHRVQCAYTIGVPGEPDSWFQAVCVANVPTTADSSVDPGQAVEMFDAILSTFRWCDDA